MKERSMLIDHYRDVQDSAKTVLSELVSFIKPGHTEKDIAAESERLLREKGLHDFWYYGVPALVLVGERTALSVSGRDYQPSEDIAVAGNDLVTVDLSPQKGDLWGDCARSFYIEQGVTKSKPTPLNKTLSQGFNLQSRLHRNLLDMAQPSMTAHELWERMNRLIETEGFKNLDFKGNLGHSIAEKLEDRTYLEEGNHSTLQDMGLFTFEPHLGGRQGALGFKHENIYYFAGQRLEML